jgi:hypothetical protein
MDVLWNACFTAVAVMLGVPLLAAVLGLCGRAALRVIRRQGRPAGVLQLTLPLRDNPPGKLGRLRAGLGLR